MLADQGHHSDSSLTRIIWNHIPRMNCANVDIRIGHAGVGQRSALLVAMTRSQGGAPQDRYSSVIVPGRVLHVSAAPTSLVDLPGSTSVGYLVDWHLIGGPFISTYFLQASICQTAISSRCILLDDWGKTSGITRPIGNHPHIGTCRSCGTWPGKIA